MPLCNRCREILPPHFIFVEENGEQICGFCKTGKNVLTLEDDYGNSKSISKSELLGKYKAFTSNVINRPDVMRKIIKDDSFIKE